MHIYVYIYVYTYAYTYIMLLVKGFSLAEYRLERWDRMLQAQYEITEEL